jgi:hypothetical protein
MRKTTMMAAAILAATIYGAPARCAEQTAQAAPAGNASAMQPGSDNSDCTPDNSAACGGVTSPPPPPPPPAAMGAPPMPGDNNSTCTADDSDPCRCLSDEEKKGLEICRQK